MKTVGLTGGIGSGKSTVATIFEKMGFLVYEADERSKQLLTGNESVIEKIREAFGEKVFGDDLKPDRKKLAALVFKKPGKLEALNGILHPAVKSDFENWMKQIPAEYGKTFILKEAAILFEAGTAAACDKVIEVFAPKSLRLARVCARDKAKPKEVEARMNRQWPESEKLRLADFHIYNDGSHPLIPQVLEAAKWLQNQFTPTKNS